ncbi:xanthine phosphoribosyltransferase [Trichococcus palustris]|jgi:xanthine phosphoribosyltransferase|uniref:Xanthine phosphoribosyltransferase n=1 Tax=Trichococcus palustris TaxID=140314 RepID=A0A143YCI7_9LACT|nr:xanthine phosphoribosyltransferase [Trichococcus palustris]CZQ85938.1 xanthine phosphoribosyltransferase [Trichococcus palustris]SFK57279.1 xanthine phosphoribosyltransferase [Trichococcus palustris]
MKNLENRIVEDGIVLENNILDVDSFLNHQIDPVLMQDIGKEFARLFRDEDITKVLTVESSGIAPAVFTGLYLEVPVVFARKNKSVTLRDNVYVTDVYSYTKETTTEMSASKLFLSNQDKVLIIDDFLANGQAVSGLLALCRQAGASVAGVGIVIEKSFQKGRILLEGSGIRLESLARIEKMDPDSITFINH